MSQCAAELEAVVWMIECDMGMHPISEEDQKALDATRPKLMEEIRSILSPPNDPSSATAAGNARSAATIAAKLPEPSNCPAGRRLDVMLG
jgi:hypothetical protein